MRQNRCPRRAPSALVPAAALLALLASASVVGAAGFGSPPPGEIPILFDDRTVYAKPDVLRRGRVLAALVKDGQLYVPLRSMFEAMGATVSASGDGKSVTAVKDGASVSVTLGKKEVVIDGVTRPLDVPPMLYKHVLLVPVRVLSEALGAYVAWVPEKRVVSVRYFAAPSAPPGRPVPAPAPAPTLAPPGPTAAPTGAPERSYDAFIQAALAAPSSYNEFAAGQYCRRSYVLGAAFAPLHSALAVKVDFREDAYVSSDNLVDSIGNHYTRFATIDGGSAFTPVFLARQSALDVRLEYRIAAPRIYVGAGYLHAANNYGYPQLNALGFGVEKLPDLRAGFNLFGSAFYYPSASGNYTVIDPASSNVGKQYRQQYGIVRFDAGLALALRRFPLYVYAGFNGDHYTAKQKVPISQTHDGPYAGLGLKL